MAGTFPKWKLVIFALLSFCDFLLTYFLLSNYHDGVYESNPVAERTLTQFGWVGLALFKSAIVLGVFGIVVYIHHRRPRIAHDLLAIGCGAVVVALLSGSSIAIAIAGELEGQSREDYFEITEVTSSTDEGPAEDYAFQLEQLSIAVRHQQISLKAATEQLQQASLVQDQDWCSALQLAYPGMPVEACLSAELVQCAVESRLRSQGARPLAERLEQEFQKMHGFIPELPYHRLLPLAPAR